MKCVKELFFVYLIMSFSLVGHPLGTHAPLVGHVGGIGNFAPTLAMAGGNCWITLPRGFDAAILRADLMSVYSVSSGIGQTSSSTKSYNARSLAHNSAGFLMAYLTSIGQKPYWAFSVDGATWSTAGPVTNDTGLKSFLYAAAAEDRFFVAWRGSDNRPYVAYISNDSATEAGLWALGVVDTQASVASAVMITATSEGALATWVDSEGAVYGNFYSLGSGSWFDSPVVISGPGSALIADGITIPDACVAGYGSNFAVAWVDAQGKGHVAHSSDNGVTWHQRGAVISNIYGQQETDTAYTNLSMFYSAVGIVAAWIGEDGNAYASFSSDKGVTWCSAVQLNGGANAPGAMYSDFGSPFVSVVAQENNCFFSWLGIDGDVYVSFSTISPTILEAGCKQAVNNLGTACEYYNTLSWAPDPVDDVGGYAITRDGAAMAVLGRNVSSHEDHNQPFSKKVTYRITALDQDLSGLTSITLEFSGCAASSVDPA